MGTVTSLLKLIKELKALDKEDTIYAAKPWTTKSKAIVLREPVSGEIPQEAKDLGLSYFIEVYIACDFIEEWEKSFHIAASAEKKCLRLIEYAINDA